MRTKAPLILLELTVMLLVLALSAALCLRAFAWADTRSRENACRDAALAELQSAAEVLKHCGGDFEAAAELHGGSWDGQKWHIVLEEFEILATPEQTRQPHLGSARLEAVYRGKVLLWLKVSWQEVS